MSNKRSLQNYICTKLAVNQDPEAQTEQQNHAFAFISTGRIAAHGSPLVLPSRQARRRAAAIARK